MKRRSPSACKENYQEKGRNREKGQVVKRKTCIRRSTCRVRMMSLQCPPYSPGLRAQPNTTTSSAGTGTWAGSPLHCWIERGCSSSSIDISLSLHSFFLFEHHPRKTAMEELSSAQLSLAQPYLFKAFEVHVHAHQQGQRTWIWDIP